MTTLPDPGLAAEPTRRAGERWTWSYDGPDGPLDAAVLAATVPGADAALPSQSDAESWLGESWRELRDAGVTGVTLWEGDREVYGPMGLDA